MPDAREVDMGVRAMTAASVLLAGAASAQPVRFRIVDLTEISQPAGVVQCEAWGVNAAGQVVGIELLPNFGYRAIYWDSDLSVSLPATLPGDNATAAYAITESGDALGVSDKVEVVNMGTLIKIFQDEKAVIWQGGPGGAPATLASMVTSGPTIDLRVIRDANALGHFCGQADVPNPSGAGKIFKGFLFENGVVTETVGLTRPMGLNDNGTVVGYTAVGQDHAIRWDSGVAKDLHHPTLTGVTSRAWDVNDDGVIAGEAQFHISKPEEPTVWINDVPQRIFPEINRPQGIATAVNNKGQIAGMVNDLDNLNEGWDGFLLEGGKRTSLLAAIDPNLGWEQLLPLGMSENGIIVGGGVRNGSLGHGFVMYPICYADCDLSGSLDLFDFLCFVNLFTGGDPLADCDESGSLDLFDFLCFVNAFNGGCA